jgi:hypothetical protein
MFKAVVCFALFFIAVGAVGMLFAEQRRKAEERRKADERRRSDRR